MAYCILSSMPPFSPLPSHTIFPSAARQRGASFLYLLRRRSGT